ncbi:alpha/beta hydrolase [Tumebacillus sp. ITR2]|uniref:Alpha/beta hydrolase n=1 Tax=Tumebacillus amylolyticus TaxID=2801339 RepID=A0ABS1J6R1_9BACL|nr:alpha/beta hydrolase [Tumebacillus amylolyticus]MBL0385865.1 alpha/beta hydrolase [Tumebacillus amylolyticus]
MAYAEVNGTSLYYEMAGSGHPLVLIHGFNLDCRLWDEQFAELQKHFQVVRYDMRGFGQSGPSAGDFSHFDDLAALLDHLEIEKTHVCGLSFGGYTAQEFALAYPDRVNKLVLVSAGLNGFPMTEIRKADIETFNAVVQTADVSAVANVFANQWLEGPGQAPGRVATEIRERFLDMVFHAFALPKPENFPKFLQPPVIQRVQEIKSPTLIIAGELDYPDISQIATYLHGRIVLSELEVLPNLAHIVNMEIPVQFNDMLLDFLGA